MAVMLTEKQKTMLSPVPFFAFCHTVIYISHSIFPFLLLVRHA
uniref:Uncharacterized protein n=1 Tax=Anguilla anguilla TaxID=7936 RepID=A0A0E9RNK7_ANGAN